MPPPRQPRLASRKSVVTDRTLYEQAQDDSDVSPPPKQLPRAARHPPPAASASSSSTIFAQPTRRRSTRLSTESTATDSPATAPTAKLRQPPLSRAKNATKSPAPPKDQRKEAATGSRTRPRVEVEQDADDEGDRDNDEDGPVLAQPKPAGKPAGGNKRQKVAPSSTGDAGLGAAPTTRAGFVPRAAAHAFKVVKPQPEYTHVVADEFAEDSEPLAFTTHPPTPHAAGKGKRAADKAAVNPRQKAPRTGRADPAPQASTSRLPSAASPPAAISTTPPHSTNAPHYVAPITTAETPKQLSNREMRSNLGIGTPGTGRRPSMEMRGRRGSSIGGGFEATPHPFVDNDKLYRSTDATKPVAVRLRALVSWTAQRQREELFSRSTGAAAKDDATKRFAKVVIDDFITEICESRLDVSVAHSADAIMDVAEFPPHPQNVVNEAKLAEVQEHYAAIQRESNGRADVLEKYSAFGARRTAPAPSTMALSTPDLAVFNSPLPVPATYEESMAVGQSLLSGQVEPRPAKATSKKGKGKEVVPTATESAMDAMTSTLADVRLQSANFRRLTHRIGQFSRISTSYVSTRIQQSHQALLADSLRGLSNVPIPVVTSDTGPLLGGIAGVVRGLTPTTGGDVGPGPEPRDLLRAIAGADHKSRNGGQA